MQKIIQIATLPERIDSFRLTAASLYDQADRIFIMLNGHRYAPAIDDRDNKISFAMLDNSLGDAAKVLNLQKDAFTFLCDDDIIYPPNYCEFMLRGHATHPLALITLHGKVYRRPVTKSHGGYLQAFHCLGDVNGDHVVDTGGSGVMLIPPNTLEISPDDCPRKNMLDIWIAKRAKEQNIPIIVIAHKRDFLTYLPQKTTIWDSHRIKDELYQVEILKSFLIGHTPQKPRRTRKRIRR
jgi:hypothetical protein